jgi:carboxypeptidase C (cathepsin A)
MRQPGTGRGGVRARAPALALLVLACAAAHAAPQPPAAPGAAAAEAKPATAAEPAVPAPRLFVSTHKGSFGGEPVTYVVTAGDTYLGGPAGHPTATLFNFSYVRQGVKDRGSRPVMFVFNGGPGSSSIWVHLAALGPRVVDLADVVHPPTVGPFHLRDNPLSPLDAVDLVFIDPVGTGFSHLLGAGKPEQYYGVQEDARATAEFIVDWLTRNDRWGSPKFVLGESYGTVRVCELVKTLSGGPTAGGSLPGVTFNGAILLGTALDHGGADAAAQSLLPTLAAIAWYHDKVDRAGRTLEGLVREAREFAATDYGAALYAGDRLTDTQRQAISHRLAGFTGLPEPWLLDHHLRVSAHQLAEELLRDKGMQLGIYDARYLLPRDGAGSDPVADDTAMGQYVPAFVAAFHEYLRGDLGVTLSDNYEVIAFRDVNSRWNYGAGGPDANHAADLAAAMRRNPAMRVLVASGYFDLATPFAAAEHALAHADMPLERVEFRTYESGHMAYLGVQPAEQFMQDLRAFLSR